MFWPYNVLVLYPWFIECPTNFHHDEDASIRQAFESSQNVKEGPKKVPHNPLKEEVSGKEKHVLHNLL